MVKKTKNVKNSKAVASTPYINRKYLAEFFGLKEKNLLFAVAETEDGVGGVNITPILAVLRTSEYISLTSGEVKTTARVQGFKQDLYPAIVLYNKERDEFTFKSSVGSKTTVSATSLSEHFGKGVIRR
ncbi:MAG: hypothetical protein NC218_08920 [Acetobacter sp.]|nr:hypothetical protein [Acetobacter sp.]